MDHQDPEFIKMHDELVHEKRARAFYAERVNEVEEDLKALDKLHQRSERRNQELEKSLVKLLLKIEADDEIITDLKMQLHFWSNGL